MRRVIGLDPGLTGGIVALDIDGDRIDVVAAHATPLCIGMRKRKPVKEYDVRAMHDLLAGLVYGMNNTGPCMIVPCVIVLERSSTRPGQAAQAVLRTGEGYGLWRGLAAAFPVEFVTVAPATWKRRMNLLHADKRASVLRAKEKFPALAALKVSQHGIAEAALIAAAVV